MQRRADVDNRAAAAAPQLRERSARRRERAERVNLHYRAEAVGAELLCGCLAAANTLFIQAYESAP